MTDLPPPPEPHEPEAPDLTDELPAPTVPEMAAEAAGGSPLTEDVSEPVEAPTDGDRADALPVTEDTASTEPGSEFTDGELLDAATTASAFDDADLPPAPEPTSPGPTEAAIGGYPPPPTPPYPPQAPPGAAYPPPGGHGQAPPVRRIYRSRHDRKLAGVSGGIAEYLRIDPTIVRVVTLLAAISGIGILVYLAAWIIVPLRPEGHHEPPSMARTANERTMTLAFGVAALALTFGIVTGSWALLAVALIGGGVWLLSEQTSVLPGLAGSGPAPYPSGPPAPHAPAPSDATFTDPLAYAAPQGAPTPSSSYGGEQQTAHQQMTYQPAAEIVEQKPQHITWLVLSLLALLAAVGIAAATGDWWNVSATRFLGIGVIIIGTGVVVGQLKRGGARGLIPLGILAALALFPVAAVDGLLDDGVGETIYRPLNIADLETSYHHGIGKLTVDLSALDFQGESETIDIDLGIGELIVIVSEETGGQAVLQATAGEIKHRLPETNSVLFEDGVNIESGTVRLEGDDGTVDLDISVGLGTAELRSRSN